jgi:2-keto-3-deoxy-L-rhamnonate aldolase RhmA
MRLVLVTPHRFAATAGDARNAALEPYAQAIRELAAHARKHGVVVRATGLTGRAATDFTRFGLREVIVG